MSSAFQGVSAPASCYYHFFSPLIIRIDFVSEFQCSILGLKKNMKWKDDDKSERLVSAKRPAPLVFPPEAKKSPVEMKAMTMEVDHLAIDIKDGRNKLARSKEVLSEISRKYKNSRKSGWSPETRQLWQQRRMASADEDRAQRTLQTLMAKHADLKPRYTLPTKPPPQMATLQISTRRLEEWCCRRTDFTPAQTIWTFDI